MKRSTHLVPTAAITLAALTVPGTALADVPMFLVIAMTRVTLWWTIPFVLAIEAAALKFIFGLAWGKAATLSVMVNAISAAVGVFLYPMVGMVVYPALYPVVTGVFGFGPMVEATATFLAMGVLDAIVELVAVRTLLRMPTLPQALWVLLANLATTGLLLGAVVYANIPPSLPREEAQGLVDAHSAELAFADRILAEAPQHRLPDSYRFDPEWFETLKDDVQGLTYRTLWISSTHAIGGTIVSTSSQQNMQGLTLIGTTEIDGFSISRFEYDWRDGGWRFYRISKSLKVDDQTFTVTAEFN